MQELSGSDRLAVLVIQHSPDVEPGFFGDYLTEKGLAWHLLRIDQGQAPPASLHGYCALGLMGGEMSVNDPLPWIEPVCQLIRDADAQGKPVIGHCLGGQLMAKAFGAQVRRHVRQELGWGQLRIADARLGQDWLGLPAGDIPTFQWHGDTFDWPPGAQALLTGQFCERQAFVIEKADGTAHLGMQCHMEMTQDLVRRWVAKGAEDIKTAMLKDGVAVQTEAEILKDVQSRCETLRSVTRRLYDRWIQSVLLRD